jgi:hypothetical protein
MHQQLTKERMHMNSTSLFMGFGLGAGAMYFLDPQQGRRRRKLVLDQIHSATCALERAADTTWRDARNRTYGTAAELRSAFSSHEAPNQVLEARVRSKLGRYVSHSSAIVVTAKDGCVTLSGPILAAEVQPLVQRVKTIPGVTRVQNELDVHQTAHNVSALQGGRQPIGERPELLQSNWSPTTRLSLGALGGMLALCSAGSRSPGSLLCGTLGMGLLACSLMPTSSQPGASPSHRQKPVQAHPSASDQSQPATDQGRQAQTSIAAFI